MVVRPDISIRIARNMYISIFIVLPIILSTPLFWRVVTVEDRTWYIGTCWGLALYFIAILYIGFWEKMFSILVLSEKDIRWKCPLRKTNIMLISDCVEIGVYLANTKNGIPKEYIYFSDHCNPHEQMLPNGLMKSSGHLIQYRYSESLSEYILRTYPYNKTILLRESIQHRRIDKM